MPLPSSPSSISLNQIHVEAGGNSGTQCSLNDSDIRGLINKSSQAQMSFNEWYGASAAQDVTMTSAAQINGENNRKEQTASTWVSSGDTLIIPSNFWLWSDDTSAAALTIDVSNITINNSGFIIGRGGNGGSGVNVDGNDGGPAIKINSGVTGVTIVNNSGAYIAGGGGGGASGGAPEDLRLAGGGGGAGGGNGGEYYTTSTYVPSPYYPAYATSGGLINGYADNVADVDDRNGSSYASVPNVVDAGAGGQGGHDHRYFVAMSGGGGGRKLGSAAVGGYIPSFNYQSNGSTNEYVSGGGSGGATNQAGASGGHGGNNGHAAGGGGGWGAAGGGNNDTGDGGPASGGAGGAAIDDSGQTYSLTNNGTIWGST